ncbi:MAG: hypothetical protein NC434_00575 [Ruminococcus sp.]|nr:hypothetical protein [Ruminococcus sp.]
MRIAVLAGNIANYIQRRLLEGIVKYAETQSINIDVFSCHGDMYENRYRLAMRHVKASLKKNRYRFGSLG